MSTDIKDIKPGDKVGVGELEVLESDLPSKTILVKGQGRGWKKCWFALAQIKSHTPAPPPEFDREIGVARRGEEFAAVKEVYEMATQSLCPETFCAFEKLLVLLCKTRHVDFETHPAPPEPFDWDTAVAGMAFEIAEGIMMWFVSDMWLRAHDMRVNMSRFVDGSGVSSLYKSDLTRADAKYDVGPAREGK